MGEQMVSSENLSRDLLQSLFDAAFMETEIDEEGDLFVREQGVGCFALIPESRKHIQLMGFATPNEDASDAARLEFVNAVNRRYVVVRAYTNQHGRVVFDTFIPVEGGISARSVVLATKRFLSIPGEALRTCDTANIFG
ncbi:MAG: hypothetical protein Kow0062_23300 [Acidobacteriota bacterium]